MGLSTFIFPLDALASHVRRVGFSLLRQVEQVVVLCSFLPQASAAESFVLRSYATLRRIATARWTLTSFFGLWTISLATSQCRRLTK